MPIINLPHFPSQAIASTQITLILPLFSTLVLNIPFLVVEGRVD